LEDLRHRADIGNEEATQQIMDYNDAKLRPY